MSTDRPTGLANWILTAQCPSRLGTVDVVTRFLREQGCYITEQQSFDDASSSRFFIRTEFRPRVGAGHPAPARLTGAFRPRILSNVFPSVPPSLP